jgi:hypothetical protein
MNTCLPGFDIGGTKFVIIKIAEGHRGASAGRLEIPLATTGDC